MQTRLEAQKEKYAGKSLGQQCYVSSAGGHGGQTHRGGVKQFADACVHDDSVLSAVDATLGAVAQGPSKHVAGGGGC